MELALQYVPINVSAVFLTEYFFFFAFQWKSPVYCIRVKKRKALSLRQRACELFTLSNPGGRMREEGKEGKRGVARLQEASKPSEAFETSTSRSRLHISREEDGGEVWSGAGEMGESDEGQGEKREPKIEERKQVQTEISYLQQVYIPHP